MGEQRVDLPHTTVFIFTRAYNAAHTIRRTIESALSQTHLDWRWYLLDNGSTDKTGDIIREYANRESRIVPMFSEVNMRGATVSILFNEILPTADNDACFCTLDADDEYAPDFLEKALAFMKSENLDIVACGSGFVDENTGELMEQRYAIDEDMIISDKKFSSEFPAYWQFMCTVWGKLYKISVLRKCSFDDTKRGTSYGNDMMFAQETFRYAKRVGILGGQLHKYYISNKSASFHYDEKRFYSNTLLFEVLSDYLRLCNGYNKQNVDIVQSLYINAIRGTLWIALESDMPVAEKLDVVNDIFSHEITRETLKNNSIPSAAKSELTDLASKRLGELTNQSLLLKGLTLQSMLYMRTAVAPILNGDWIAALEALIVLGENEIPDEFAEDYINLGLNISAVGESAETYVFFNKLYIVFLIDNSRIDEAKSKLDELLEILPNDDELKVLEERLAQ